MNNNYENSEAKCAGFSRSVGTKLTYLMIGGGIGGIGSTLIRPETGTRISGRYR